MPNKINHFSHFVITHQKAFLRCGGTTALITAVAAAAILGFILTASFFPHSSIGVVGNFYLGLGGMAFPVISGILGIVLLALSIRSSKPQKSPLVSFTVNATNATSEEEIFDGEEVSQEEFVNLCEQWGEEAQGLSRPIRTEFTEFLSALKTNNIRAQGIVFATDDDMEDTYAKFRMLLKYIHDQLQTEEQNIYQQVIEQLNEAVGSCPLGYHQAIYRALLIVNHQADRILESEGVGKMLIHVLSALRANIATEVANKFGDSDTHTFNGILQIIGQERALPHTNFTINDRKNDLSSIQKDDLLAAFDQRYTSEAIIRWVHQEIHGKGLSGKRAVNHQFLIDYLKDRLLEEGDDEMRFYAAIYNMSISEIENPKSSYEISEEMIAILLEEEEILIPEGRSQKEKFKERFQSTSQ